MLYFISRIQHKLNLTPGVWHTQVKAMNAEGWSDWSEETTFEVPRSKCCPSQNIKSYLRYNTKAVTHAAFIVNIIIIFTFIFLFLLTQMFCYYFFCVVGYDPVENEDYEGIFLKSCFFNDL